MKANLQITSKNKVQYISEFQFTKPLPHSLDGELPTRCLKENSNFEGHKVFLPSYEKRGVGGALMLNKTPATKSEALFKGRSLTYIKPINTFSLYHKTKTCYQLYLLMSPTNPNCPQRTYTAKKCILEKYI